MRWYYFTDETPLRRTHARRRTFALTLDSKRDIQYTPLGLTAISGGNLSVPDWSFSLPHAITGEELLRAVQSESFIKGGDPLCAEGIKYDFRMGSQILKAKFGRSMDMDKMAEDQKAEMVIDPGEVVFVLTEETLELPNSIMAQLSPKRKLSHDGILVLGGFCIDPLYSGKLLVGLYNFSSSRFVLEPRRKLIAAIFYELQEGERGEFQKPETSVTDFPRELVRLISTYQPVNIQGLRDDIGTLELQIGNLRSEITTDKEWKRDFQTKLELQATNIDKLLKGLDEERDIRTSAEKAITTELNAIKVQQAASDTQGKANNSLFVAIITIVITVIVTVAITLFTVWLATRAT
jgi:deoxycytidine triphosphate deaminase